ncbi:hypothetical protein Nepgr_021785 [Nepenthes gracilis]|uniref:Uncharacterized protein n=1 Tax=Nepenthes gracilis TaxID=150966 RepID=A0AAD3SZA3_NEPGR|nr:hypothetical protein Nepgr_021785 [Nepenthes gracilis]
MGPSEDYEATKLPISDVGQNEEVTETVVVETIDKNLHVVFEHEVRGEEETKIALGAAEILNSELPKPEDKTNTDMSFEIQPFEPEVQINI